jgi:NAD(P)-dependent dehydrogenase (short-subunit alcohol dehydrogenase family)
MLISFPESARILVTGASSGLGKATVLFLNSLGVEVIALARNEEKLRVLIEEATYPEKIKPHVYDLSHVEDIVPEIKRMVLLYGKFTGLVHSAGIGGVMPLKSISLDDAKAMFDINYFSGLMLAKAFSDKRNIVNGFSLVYIASISAISGNAGISNYSASKGAILSMIKSLAVELAKQKIRVNAVSPGFIVTDIVKSAPDVYNQEFFDKISNEYPLGSGESNDVASMICFLLSSHSRWITGQNFVIDGGRTLL